MIENDQRIANLEIGNNLTSLRLQNGQSQASTAQLLGVSPQQVQKYESGSNRISAAAILMLSRNWSTPIHVLADMGQIVIHLSKTGGQWRDLI